MSAAGGAESDAKPSSGPWLHRVGDQLRVMLPPGEAGLGEARTSRATVAFTNEDDSVDVVYHQPEWAGGFEEESHVPPSRVMPLLPFEVGSSAEDVNIKEQGDALFAIKDHGAAFERYAAALRRLLPTALRVGTEVVVRQNGSASTTTSRRCRYRKATVADVNASSVDVLYDDDEGGEEEEDGVSLCRVTAVAGRAEEQVKVLLNQARCHLNGTTAKPDEAVALATMALALLVGRAGGDEGEEGPGVGEQKNSGRALTTSAYKVCCVAYMRAQEWKEAKRSATLLSRLPGQGETGSRLMKEVEREMERRQQQNKKLVKTMSQWIDTAMKKGTEVQQHNGTPPGEVGGGAPSGSSTSGSRRGWFW